MARSKKRKKITIPKKVLKYLQKKKIATTKKIICREMKLKRSTVNSACRILRKQKLIGMYYRKYWGTV